MSVVNVTNARKTLYQLISDVNEYSTPVTITNNKGKNAVLVSEDDWKALIETVYLQNVPGMVESIMEGAAEPLDQCEEYQEDQEW